MLRVRDFGHLPRGRGRNGRECFLFRLEASPSQIFNTIRQISVPSLCQTGGRGTPRDRPSRLKFLSHT